MDPQSEWTCSWLLIRMSLCWCLYLSFLFLVPAGVHYRHHELRSMVFGTLQRKLRNCNKLYFLTEIFKTKPNLTMYHPKCIPSHIFFSNGVFILCIDFFNGNKDINHLYMINFLYMYTNFAICILFLFWMSFIMSKFSFRFHIVKISAFFCIKFYTYEVLFYLLNNFLNHMTFEQFYSFIFRTLINF